MPLMQIERYHRPSDVKAAWRLLADGDGTAVLVGGGTDLVVRCPQDARALIDLGAAGLRYVEGTEEGGLRLGAMSTFTDLLEHPAVATYGTGVLGEMLTQVGSVLHRNSATLGGHVVRSRLSDVLPVLLALDASVVLYAGERTELAVADYLVRDPAPHVVVEVGLPPRTPGTAAAFTRFSRTAFDHALVNACCRVDVDDEVVVAARVVVGESATVGQRVEEAEQHLVGEGLTAATIDAAVEATSTSVTCRGDWIASADYRRHLAGVAVRRCLDRVGDRLHGGAT